MKRNQGMTLMEILVVVVISTLILGVVYTVSNTCQSALETDSVLLDIQREAARAMDKMVRELYVAGGSMRVDSPMSSFGNMITFQVLTRCTVAACGNTGTIYTDINRLNWGDGEITGNRIRYLVPNSGNNAGRLVRRVLTPDYSIVSETVLARDLAGDNDAIAFTGFGRDGAQTTITPKAVRINITTQKDTLRGPLRASLQSLVTLRN